MNYNTEKQVFLESCIRNGLSSDKIIVRATGKADKRKRSQNQYTVRLTHSIKPSCSMTLFAMYLADQQIYLVWDLRGGTENERVVFSAGEDDVKKAMRGERILRKGVEYRAWQMESVDIVSTDAIEPYIRLKYCE